MSLSYDIELTVGDYWNDGHGQHRSVIIRSSLFGEEIKEAYLEGCNKVGINLVDDICRSYEDGCISKIDYEKFVAAGFTHPYGPEYSTDDNYYCLDSEFYTDLYLFMIKLGNPEFEYEKIKTDKIDIGGYGLFC